MKAKVTYKVIVSITRYGELFQQVAYGINDVVPEIIQTLKVGRKKVFKKTEIIKEWVDEKLWRMGRKYTADLELEDFLEFVEECDFYETCDTMGMLLSTEEWLPAVSFSRYENSMDNWEINAYVSPVIEVEQQHFEIDDIELVESRTFEYQRHHNNLMEVLLDSEGCIEQLEDGLVGKVVFENWLQPSLFKQL